MTEIILSPNKRREAVLELLRTHIGQGGLTAREIANLRGNLFYNTHWDSKPTYSTEIEKVRNRASQALARMARSGHIQVVPKAAMDGSNVYHHPDEVLG